MENSKCYFCNKACEYYPCHNGIEDINCLFCYCPLYAKEKCPGNYVMIKSGDKMIKDCSKCLFPHLSKNYDTIIKILENE